MGWRGDPAVQLRWVEWIVDGRVHRRSVLRAARRVSHPEDSLCRPHDGSRDGYVRQDAGRGLFGFSRGQVHHLVGSQPQGLIDSSGAVSSRSQAARGVHRGGGPAAQLLGPRSRFASPRAAGRRSALGPGDDPPVGQRRIARTHILEAACEGNRATAGPCRRLAARTCGVGHRIEGERYRAAERAVRGGESRGHSRGLGVGAKPQWRPGRRRHPRDAGATEQVRRARRWLHLE